jgi:hypothetical protein
MTGVVPTAIVLIVLFAGCQTADRAHLTVGTVLTPAKEAGPAEVKTFVEATARAYKVQPPAIMVADHAWDACPSPKSCRVAPATSRLFGHVQAGVSDTRQR